MFKNREILSEVEYLKETCQRMEEILKLVCKNETKIEDKIDDLKITLVNILQTPVNDIHKKGALIDEFDHLMNSISCLKESIFECQKMIFEDKINIPLTKEQKKNSKSRNTKKSGTK